MKILVEMSPEHYDRLLDKLSEESAVYAILKNGVVVHPSGASEDRIIQIACEMTQAETLLTRHGSCSLQPLLNFRRVSDWHNLSENKQAGAIKPYRKRNAIELKRFAGTLLGAPLQ